MVREMFARNSQFVESAFKWKPIRTIAEDLVQSATNELHDKLTTLPKYPLFSLSSPFLFACANDYVDIAKIYISRTRSTGGTSGGECGHTGY